MRKTAHVHTYTRHTRRTAARAFFKQPKAAGDVKRGVGTGKLKMSEEEERERWPVSASWMLRDTEYVVSCCVSGNVLEVQVEEALTTDQWRGRFEAKRKSSLCVLCPAFVAVVFKAA